MCSIPQPGLLLLAFEWPHPHLDMTDAEWKQIRHFTPDEFDARDSLGQWIPGSGLAMQYAFVMKLDQLRDALGLPLYIHSGIRTPGRNVIVGGVDSSSHLTGHAADVEVIGSRMRFLVRNAAAKVGFLRIGSGETFIHLDDDPTKVQDVEWLYPSTASRIAV